MNSLYSISILLFIGWLCGCFFNSEGGTFYALAGISALAILPVTVVGSRKKAQTGN